jgi:hypothetical protein
MIQFHREVFHLEIRFGSTNFDRNSRRPPLKIRLIYPKATQFRPLEMQIIELLSQ